MNVHPPILERVHAVKLKEKVRSFTELPETLRQTCMAAVTLSVIALLLGIVAVAMSGGNRAH